MKANHFDQYEAHFLFARKAKQANNSKPPGRPMRVPRTAQFRMSIVQTKLTRFRLSFQNDDNDGECARGRTDVVRPMKWKSLPLPDCSYSHPCN